MFCTQCRENVEVSYDPGDKAVFVCLACKEDIYARAAQRRWLIRRIALILLIIASLVALGAAVSGALSRSRSPSFFEPQPH